MKNITIEWVKENRLLIFESIVGSRAYGLDTEKSDTDIRGVFIIPKKYYYSLGYVAQVSNEKNDIVYYELNRFVELLLRNNPNILELLSIPEKFIISRHKIYEHFSPEMFLSKLCERTFANYALSQIKKAYGLEKKILNPMSEQRRSVIDFCYVYSGHDVILLTDYLIERKYDKNNLGLSVIPHLRDCYNLYYSKESQYSGIVSSMDANDVHLSAISKSETPIGLLYFNKDAYSVYCKKYNEYWEWVKKRNEERYSNTMQHGKKYDSKNMMHVFRLLNMAKEIAIEKRINVNRKDRDFLLAIKEGKYDYEELLLRAENLQLELPFLYATSELPVFPDYERVNELLVNVRETYYSI